MLSWRKQDRTYSIDNRPKPLWGVLPIASGRQCWNHGDVTGRNGVKP